MNPKFRQTLSLLVTGTVVLGQTGAPVFANTTDVNTIEYQNTQDSTSTDIIPENISDEILNTDTIPEISSEEFLDTETIPTADNQGSQSEFILEETEEELIPYAVAQNSQVVYTHVTKGNSDRTGNGTSSHPYNRFEDALANVEDGGTIIIKNAKGAFINGDEHGQIPLIIDKKITIRGEDGSEPADLNVRAAGIILGADVTFENISFGFANAYHDSIFANGHTLTLRNCVRENGSRQIDLFAGSLYEKYTNNLVKGYKYDKSTTPSLETPSTGSDGKIIIETTTRSSKNEFGKVFAGSMNGPYTGNATIEINNKGYLDLVSIHSCGALETPVNNIFDTTEPLPPSEAPASYPVKGKVNINLNEYITDINGEGADEVHATLSPRYSAEHFEIKDVNSITVGSKEIMPDDITWKNDIPGDIILDSNTSILNLSKVDTLTVNNFKSKSGDAILILAKDGCLTIENDITGQAVFQTPGGAVNHSFSGLVNENHNYIISSPDKGDKNSFIFRGGIGAQAKYEFKRKDNGEWVFEAVALQVTLPTTINKLEFDQQEVDLFVVIPGMTKHTDVPLTIETDLSLDDIYITDLPFELYISGKKATPYPGSPGTWYDPDLNLEFILDDFNSSPRLGVALHQPDVIPAFGTYDIVLALPNYNNISTSFTLNVTDTLDLDSPTSDKSSVGLSIKKNGSEVTQLSFGEQVILTAQTQSNTHPFQTFASQDEIDFVVNDKIVKTAEVVNNGAEVTLDVTPENGFKEGTNNIKVVYGGSSLLIGSNTEKQLNITKPTPTLSLVGNTQVTYDGKAHSLQATVSGLAAGLKNVTPTIYYSKDANFNTVTTNAPIDAGTYYVKAVLPESDAYNAAAEVIETLVISEATPNTMLFGTVINQNDGTSDLELTATMSYPVNGATPNGEIEFQYVDANNQTQTVRSTLLYGTTKHTIENLNPGSINVTARYIPTTNGNYVAGTLVKETFEVIDNFVPVQDIELITSELQLYTDSTNIEIPFTITPDHASVQKVVWESSDPNIISIKPNTRNNGAHSLASTTANLDTGILDVKGTGQVTITARTKDGGYSHSCIINVVDANAGHTPVQSITLNKSNLVLDNNTNTTEQLVATVAPLNATLQDVIWKSNDNTIASVDDHGNVTAHKVGRTQITALTKDGAKIATCDIQVQDSTASKVNVDKIEIKDGQTLVNDTTITVKLNELKNLQATISPDHATDKGLKWTSANPNVVKVSEHGTLKPITTGSTQITVSALDGSGVTATFTVTVIDNAPIVKPVEVTSIKVMDGVNVVDTTLSINLSETKTLQAAVYPNNATNKNVSWKSSDESVITVVNGKLTPVATGTATITVSALDGSGVTSTFNVKVIKNTTSNDSSNGGSSNGGSSNSGSSNGGSSNGGSSNSGSSNGGSSNNETTENNGDATISTPQKPVVQNPSVEQFKDLSNHWAINDVQFVLERGLFKGISESNFGANDVTTRGMFVTVLHRYAGSPLKGNASFSDVNSNSYYANAVNWATSTGIASGIIETEFGPNQKITREQLVVMLYRYAKILDIDTTITTSTLSQFKDSNNVSSWSKEAIEWAIDKGILVGDTHNKISPKDSATRAQVAAVLKRFIQLVEA